MAPHLLRTFHFPINIHDFLDHCWENQDFYEHFLIHHLKDLGVQISSWTEEGGEGIIGSTPNKSSLELKDVILKTRNVKCFHPSKISFPGLPSHAESLKVQTLEIIHHPEISSTSPAPPSSSAVKQQQQNNNNNNNTLTTIPLTPSSPSPLNSHILPPSTPVSSSSSIKRKIKSLIIKETNSFRGIPYADYFNVLTEWKIHEAQLSENNNNLSNPTTTTTSIPMTAGSMNGCIVHIYLEFKFHKSTWLQGTIESNTKAELLEVMDLWSEAVSHQIRTMDNKRILQSLENNNLSNDEELGGGGRGGEGDGKLGLPKNLSEKFLNSEKIKGKGSSRGSLSDLENQKRAGGRNPENEAVEENEMDEEEDEEGYYDEEEEMLRKSTYETNSSDGDDLQFYDCEEMGYESAATSTKLMKRISHENSSLKLKNNLSMNSLYDDHKSYPDDYYFENIDLQQGKGVNPNGKDYSRSTPPALRKIYAEIHARERAKLISGNYHPSHKDFKELENITTARDLAVSIVETVFVLAEFLFWQVYRFYAYDLKDLFRTDLSRVSSRVVNSFIPGWHVPLLHTPDIYGPLIAVFMLPQTLLLSMETGRIGCNPTSQLGNAVVVSLFIWFGLSGLYRLMALLVAPSIHYKHCLSVVGYSFYSWNLAILCSLPLDHYQEAIKIPSMLPLMIFGIPTAIAQGYMFWEHTPPSNLVLQPTTLPTSLQSCANHNSRWIQRIIWALPKIIAFALVAGTHYQLLWYIARVFLPGRRQLCRLSSLIQPAQYADILSQKEIRVFLLKMLTGKDD